jgi:hypothetical protein
MRAPPGARRTRAEQGSGARLALHDRAQAVVLAYESGLVQPGETPAKPD